MAKAALSRNSKNGDQTKKGGLGKGIIYSRTSSKANEHGASSKRQVQAAQRTALQQRVKIVSKVVETVSGSMPADRRNILNKLIDNAMHKGVNKIYVESCRAVARSADANESLYKRAVKNGVDIIPADMPNLYAKNPTPVGTFVRRVVIAMQELEKDLIVGRLKDGRAKAMSQRQQCVKRQRGKTLCRQKGQLTQGGKAKVVGAKTTLQKYGRVSAAKVQKMKKASRERAVGKFGWRRLQEEFSDILGIQVKSHEAARRMAQELKVYY